MLKKNSLLVLILVVLSSINVYAQTEDRDFEEHSIQISLTERQYEINTQQKVNFYVSGEMSVDVYVALVYPDGNFVCLKPEPFGEFGLQNLAEPLLTNWETESGEYSLDIDVSSINIGVYTWYVIFCLPGESPEVISNWINSSTVDFVITDSSLNPRSESSFPEMVSITGGTFRMGNHSGQYSPWQNKTLNLFMMLLLVILK